ncbi:MAG: hypothetical protein ACI30W_00925 [Muribaculaceae bacterium]
MLFGRVRYCVASRDSVPAGAASARSSPVSDGSGEHLAVMMVWLLRLA